MIEKPRILLFTGHGKGKTTAALGMAFRASGHGMRTCIIQFIKGDTSVGEVLAAAVSTAVKIYPTGMGFTPPREDSRFEQHRAAAQAGLHKAAEVLKSHHYPIVVLDEICTAVSSGLIDEEQVKELCAKAPHGSCLVLTGRDATPALIALADTVTEMRCVKHALLSGRIAQDGVER
jgi:cob(I)alamin adenosyltransferase